jgi:tetratricopeptide (TPR) repeat protein
MDVQGADKARPYTESAGATFTTVVDQENLLVRLYGFKAVPNGFIIDEDGVLRYKRLSGFDIRRSDTAEVLDRWMAGSVLDDEPDGTKSAELAQDSGALFQEGQSLFNDGKVAKALAKWREALALDPANYIIRKQIWAVEDPDRFYHGDIDYDWQREQMEQER